MPVSLYIIIFILGLCVGSFLNCFVYRLETGKPFTKGRSLCPKCHHRLGVLDLIPIVSFLMLKRKCRYCKKKIHWQYFLVEVFVGILFVLIAYYILGNLALIRIIGFLYFATIFSLLAIIFLYDLKHYIIPDVIIYPAIILVFLFRGIGVLIFGTGTNIINALLSAFFVALFFFLIWLISKGKWMGFGDVKLALFMGLFLGWPNILVALFLAFSLGSLVGVLLIIFGRKKLRSEVPFGPFLIAGTLLAFFWGSLLIKWYISLISL